MRILIVNVMGAYSYGGRAVIKGAIRSLKENMPGVKLTLMSSHYKQEKDIYQKWGYKDVELIDHIWYKDTGSISTTILRSSIFAGLILMKFYIYKLMNNSGPFRNPFVEYDMIIDLTTDGPTDHYGPIMAIYSLFNTYLAVMTGKKVSISGASIGVFNRKTTKYLAKYVLNKLDLITVREEITLNYLREIGVNKPSVYLTADHAFLMEPAPGKRVDDIFGIEKLYELEGPIVGISASQLIHKYAFPNISDVSNKYQKYINIVRLTIEYISTHLKCSVILIPHSSAASGIAASEDDHAVSIEIYKGLKNKYRVKLIGGNYDADELKGIIGRCDMFIGYRMHPTIASTSMAVPTVAVVYGHKSHGILGKMLGQEKCIVEIGKYDPDEFLSKANSTINYTWNNREEIKKELKERTKYIEEKALLNGWYIKKILEEHS